MEFFEQKKKTLSKIDKSKKGEIDSDILDIVNYINSKDNYYTTSSCSGRINIISKKSGKKYDCDWLITSHDQIGFKELKLILEKPSEYKTWFREEPMILHVCCKNIVDANHFLKIAKTIYKRAGIISIEKRIIVEIIGSEFMDTIISKDRKMLVSDDYIKVLIEEANLKLASNKTGLKRFYETLKKML
jgi:tRNA wybutosine-synthesizing protein 3